MVNPRRLDQPHAPFERLRPTPALDQDGRARRHAHRILSEEIDHDFQVGRVGELEERGARRHHRLALLQHAQHAAAHGRSDLPRLAGSA